MLVEGFPEGYIPGDFICPMQASAKYPPATAYGAEQVIYSHGQSRSRDVSTDWSIDWFPVIIWFGMLKYPQKNRVFSLINILLKNNLSNNWNNLI